MCKNTCICKSLYTEFVMGAGPSVSLPVSEQLRQFKVLGLYVRPNTADTAKTKKKVALPPPAVLATCILELKDQKGSVILEAPLEMFAKDFSSPDYFCIEAELIDPAQSQVWFDSGAAGFSATDALEITWILECPKSC